MVGQLSQLIHLVAASRAAAIGTLPGDFYPSHGEFKFCNSVEFVDFRRGWFGKRTEVTVAATPNEWLAQLSTAGVSTAFLRHWETDKPRAPDHALVGFVGGGGPWAFVASFQCHCEIWMARWEVSKERAPDSRIWSVTYGCVDKTPIAARPAPKLAELSAQLHEALSRIEDFALAHDLGSFAPSFSRGREALQAVDPAFPQYVDTSLLGVYSVPARRLLAASYAAWVFGGMGSWNDTGFQESEIQAAYQLHSKALYDAINMAVEGATLDH